MIRAWLLLLPTALFSPEFSNTTCLVSFIFILLSDKKQQTITIFNALCVTYRTCQLLEVFLCNNN